MTHDTIVGRTTLPDDIQRYFLVERCLSPKQIELFRFGWDGKGITIPMDGGYIKRRNVTRYDATTGKLEHGESGKMIWLRAPEAGEPLPPYPSWRDLRSADVIVEGELDAATAGAMGFQAASGTAGAGTWLSEWSDSLTGRTVTLLYDHDDAGRSGARKAAESLTRAGVTVRIASWPSTLPAGFDVGDFFRTGGAPENLQRIIDAAVPYAPTPIQPKIYLSDTRAGARTMTSPALGGIAV